MMQASASSQAFPKEFLEKVVAGADPNVLRMALYQLTDDPDLAAMQPIMIPNWGGTMQLFALSEADSATVRRKALDYLSREQPQAGQTPTQEEAQKLMEMYAGERLNEAQSAFGYEELAFEDFSRAANWTNRPADEKVKQFRVAIIGAGHSGIAAAAQLQRLGIPYTIFERQAAPGGTWLFNGYPGARVDVPSANYQFKFMTGYQWQSLFAPQRENLAYIQWCADQLGITPNTRCGVEVQAAHWEEDASKWRLTIATSDGATETHDFNVVISAAGLFSTPQPLAIPGIESFEGPAFHSTAWRHDIDLKGKRVGLVGNGSSGAQLMPQLVEEVGELYVFQRTPQWIMRADGYFASVPEQTKWLCENFPYYANWYSYSGHRAVAKIRDMVVYDQDWIAQGGRINEKNDELRRLNSEYIEVKLSSRPDLIPHMIPDYAPWGRRLVVDSGWYDALTADNVTLVPQGIEKVVPHGVITSAGEEVALDALVLATGFQTTRYFFPVSYVGRGGMTLDKLWEKDGPRSYLALSMPYFPNLFTIYGAPNSQPFGGSMISWIEVWSRYVTQCIVRLIEDDMGSIECKVTAYDAYNDHLDAEEQRIIWSREGVGGYILTRDGRQFVNSPF